MSDLWKAFEETHYIVHHKPPFTLRIGRSCPELDALLLAAGHDCATFITAWNPMCKALDIAENRQRQQCLADELAKRKLSTLPGIGQHPSNGWQGEESFLVLGLQLEAARALAKAYGQLAYVWIGLCQPAQLIET